MITRVLTTTAIAGAALVFAIPAWGDSERPATLAVSPEVASRLAAERQDPVLDARPATLAVSPEVARLVASGKLQGQSSVPVVRDHGDATDAKLAPQSSPQIVIIRDHGDATQARLTLQSAPTIVRDHGDATQAKLTGWEPTMAEHIAAQEKALGLDRTSPPPVEEPFGTTSGRDVDWSQLGIGFGVGMFFILGVILAVRFTRSQRLAH